MAGRRGISVIALLGLVACSLIVSTALATRDDRSAQATSQAIVKTAPSRLGRILVDAHGRTLYLWTSDRANRSSCLSDFGCPTYWPPLLTAGKPRAGSGVNARLLGTIHRTRPAGLQVTYNGHPLYYDAADTSPGDIKGQGQINEWYAVSPAGKPIKKK